MKRRLPLLIATALACGLLIAAAAPGILPAPQPPLRLEAPIVSANPDSAVLACPPGVLDPFEPEGAASSAGIWSSTGLGARDRAPSELSVEAQEGEALSLPTALVLAGQGGGELLGLSATACSAPRADQWIILGSTRLGSDALLVLANPSAAPSTVTISANGAAGPLGDGPQTLSVPAHSTITALPAAWFPDEDGLALRIRSEGAGVAAFAQLSVLDGEVPQGTTWTSAQTPAASSMILGVGGEDSAILRIAVPGAEPARVRASILGSEEESPLTGAGVSIDAGTVLAIPLDGASPEEAALSIESDQPVIAAVERAWTGSAFPSSTAPWRLLSTSLPATPVTSAPIPGADALKEIITAQMSRAAKRPTSVPTPSGIDASRAKLLLAPLQDADAAVNVEVGGRRIELAAGRSTIVELPARDLRIEADAPIRASLLIEAATPNGTVHASWPIGTAGLRAWESRVSVSP